MKLKYFISLMAVWIAYCIISFLIADGISNTASNIISVFNIGLGIVFGVWLAKQGSKSDEH